MTAERTLRGKTLFITGASRGIGKAIALRAARDGARIVIAAKTKRPHPKLEGTIYTAAEEIRAAGGEALPLVVDVRDEESIEAAVAESVRQYRGIDVVVNNASAILLAGTLDTPTRRMDLMHQINTRGTFLVSKHCVPHLLLAENPHVLNIAPPLELKPHWFGAHLAYTMAKYGMTLCAHGMAQEFRERGVAFNTLWPCTTIATAAVRNLLGGEEMVARSRTPEIMADAAHAILTRPARTCTGNFFLDEDVLEQEGVTDFERYAVTPGGPLQRDLFLD